MFLFFTYDATLMGETNKLTSIQATTIFTKTRETIKIAKAALLTNSSVAISAHD